MWEQGTKNGYVTGLSTRQRRSTELTAANQQADNPQTRRGPRLCSYNRAGTSSAGRRSQAYTSSCSAVQLSKLQSKGFLREALFFCSIP